MISKLTRLLFTVLVIYITYSLVVNGGNSLITICSILLSFFATKIYSEEIFSKTESDPDGSTLETAKYPTWLLVVALVTSTLFQLEIYDKSRQIEDLNVTNSNLNAQLGELLNEISDNELSISNLESELERVSAENVQLEAQLTSENLFNLGTDIYDFGLEPTALCADGSYSYSANRQGTCSHHGGVQQWHP